MEVSHSADQRNLASFCGVSVTSTARRNSAIVQRFSDRASANLNDPAPFHAIPVITTIRTDTVPEIACRFSLHRSLGN
jgi:hypothetical protein